MRSLCIPLRMECGYPFQFFAGAVKTLLIAAVPMFFIVVLPERLIDHFDLGSMISCLSFIAAWAVLARFMFVKGLSRYRNGSSWESEAVG